MRRSATLLVICIALAVTLWIACGEDHPLVPESAVLPGAESVPEGDGLLIAPIDGFTTAWHRAPAQTAVPAGQSIVFACPATPSADVIWSGAQEFMRDERYSVARCTPGATGAYTVSVTIPAGDRKKRKRDNDGGPARATMTASCALDVLPVAPGDITVSVSGLEPSVAVGNPVTNEETMRQFFRPSIASVRKAPDGHYITSVNHNVVPIVNVRPRGFLPLVETRVDGVAMQLGTPREQRWAETGRHVVSVGPPAGNPARIEVETYSTRITSHTQGVDLLPEGQSIVFMAETAPPGYEDDILWISSTKYGTATPVLGRGATFTARFDDTWGGDPQSRMQWLGVRADNAAVAQDGSATNDAALEIAPGFDTLSLLNGQTTITVAAVGVLDSPHTVTWSTNHPEVIVTPSSSTVNFSPTGELIELVLNAALTGDSLDVMLIGDVVGVRPQIIQKALKFWNTAHLCKILVETNNDGSIRTQTIRGPATSPVKEIKKSFGFSVGMESVISSSPTSLTIGTTVGGVTSNHSTVVTYRCSPQNVCPPSQTTACLPTVTVVPPTGTNQQGWLLCTCP